MRHFEVLPDDIGSMSPAQRLTRFPQYFELAETGTEPGTRVFALRVRAGRFLPRCLNSITICLESPRVKIEDMCNPARSSEKPFEIKAESSNVEDPDRSQQGCLSHLQSRVLCLTLSYLGSFWNWEDSEPKAKPTGTHYTPCSMFTFLFDRVTPETRQERPPVPRLAKKGSSHVPKFDDRQWLQKDLLIAARTCS